MKLLGNRSLMAVALCYVVLGHTSAYANAYRERGKLAQIAGSVMTVTPARDWNRLDIRLGKFTETWTLDGEQLNDVTFYAGVEIGQSLVKEKNRKTQPLPKFTEQTLLVEIPELLENTYRAYKRIGQFDLKESRRQSFLGAQGVYFSYEYVDVDGLQRNGVARAVIISKKLYMITYDAPSRHFFDHNLADFQALADSAQLK